MQKRVRFKILKLKIGFWILDILELKTPNYSANPCLI
jgi:hypothetical protein